MRTRAHCVEANCKIFARRDQSWVTDQARASFSPVSQILTALGSKSSHARRKGSHKQYGFVWSVCIVGIPHLLEFWTKLSQFGWLRTPLDSRVDSAGYHGCKLAGDETIKYQRTRFLSGPSLSSQTGQWQLRNKSVGVFEFRLTALNWDTPSIAPSSFRIIASNVCASSDEKHGMNKAL